MTAKQQIENEIKTATANRNAWIANNEGNKDCYNPFDSVLENLMSQHAEITASEIKAKLSGESLKAERVAFNAQKFTAATLQKANAWCLGRGYSLADLQAAVKNNQ